ncbi:MAG: YccF domain-containing protein [Actinomycetota bacterium]
MRLIGNVLWVVLGGFFLALGYAIAGVIMLVFIITIPFAIQAFKLASFSLWPFGRVLVARPGAGKVSSFLGNILWFVFGGIWMAIGHLFSALIMAITIIGIPFAIAHLKLARVAAWPFGFTIVPASMATPSEVVVGVPRVGGPG